MALKSANIDLIPDLFRLIWSSACWREMKRSSFESRNGGDSAILGSSACRRGERAPLRGGRSPNTRYSLSSPVSVRGRLGTPEVVPSSVGAPVSNKGDGSSFSQMRILQDQNFPWLRELLNEKEMSSGVDVLDVGVERHCLRFLYSRRGWAQRHLGYDTEETLT